MSICIILLNCSIHSFYNFIGITFFDSERNDQCVLLFYNYCFLCMYCGTGVYCVL